MDDLFNSGLRDAWRYTGNKTALEVEIRFAAWAEGIVSKLSDVQVLKDTTIVGDNHMKLFFQDTRGNPGEAIAFGWDRPETPDDLHGRAVDIAVTVKKGSYMNQVYPELRVLDLRHHAG